MAKRLYIVLLLSVVLSGSAFAQTSGTAGAGLTNPYGAVALPGTAAGSSSPPAGAAAGAGGASAPLATSVSPLSGRSGSSSPSAPGPTKGSNSVPAWLLCAPAGALGMAPFLAGTNLSCAP
jgi:hypothetical protein